MILVEVSNHKIKNYFVFPHKVLIPPKQNTAIAIKMAALKDLSWPQTYESEKKHPARYSQAHPKPNNPATAPMGERITNPRTN